MLNKICFSPEKILTERMPADYYYYFFRRNQNAAKVRSKQIRNSSKITLKKTYQILILASIMWHFSKDFINIKSCYLYNNAVKSVLLWILLYRWTNWDTERLSHFLKNIQIKNAEPGTKVCVLHCYTLLPSSSLELISWHYIKICCFFSCLCLGLKSFSIGWWA